VTFSRATFQAPPEIQCYGKVRYPSRKAAKQSIRRHNNRSGLTAYICPHCSNPDAKSVVFHIGHRPAGPS
jgi:hypothetical protein